MRTTYAKTGKIKKLKVFTPQEGVTLLPTLNVPFFTLPEFSDKKIIKWNFNVFEDKNLEYDLIIGRDLMSVLKLDILFSKNVVSSEGVEIPMVDFRQLSKYEFTKKELKAFISNTSVPVVTEAATKRVIKILDAQYAAVDLRQVSLKATHLNTQQRELLYQLLIKYQDIFDGSLGEWRTEPVDFELKEGAEPQSQRHYPIPHVHKETFKKELKRLIKLGVLERVQKSEWGSPTFIISKKNNTVRFTSDFRRLNTKIKRKPYPLPRISDTLQELEGFKYASSLDLNMGYYHIRLSEKSSDMCTIVTEFGKFRYKRLPMGVAGSPDVF